MSSGDHFFYNHRFVELRIDKKDKQFRSSAKKIVGPNQENFGIEWASNQYDNLDKKVDEIISKLGTTKVEVLDVACARGARANSWALKDLPVTAVDVSAHEESFAERNARLEAGGKPKISFIKRDILDVPVRSPLEDRFAVANARRFIHFKDYSQLEPFFNTMSRLVKQDGYLAVCFISQPRSETEERPFVDRKKGLHASIPAGHIVDHHFSEVYHIAATAGWCVTDAYSDPNFNVGFIAQNTRTPRPSKLKLAP